MYVILPLQEMMRGCFRKTKNAVAFFQSKNVTVYAFTSDNILTVDNKSRQLIFIVVVLLSKLP